MHLNNGQNAEQAVILCYPIFLSLYVNVSKIKVLLLFMYGEANRSNSQKIVCYAHRSQEKGHIVSWGPYMEATGLVEAEGAGRMWARAYIMVSLGRNGQGR